MKKLVLIVLSTLGASLATVPAQELRTVTQVSGPLAVPANSVVQIVGVAVDTFDQNSYPAGRPKMTIIYADGTKVENELGEVSAQGYSASSNNLIGHTYAGVTSISVTNGYRNGAPGALKAAVTVKLLSQASEVVSTPMVLPPVNDSLYVITLETSVDMTNWAPSFPGEFLGNGNHRFFRVKAVRKPVAAPAAE